MFSADLADGIAVSILDSFILELPVLDFSMVQSVFGELDKNLPPHEDRVQQTTGKERYFQDIRVSAQLENQESSDKISPQRKDQVGQSSEKGKCNENTVSLLQRKIKTTLGKRLAQPDDQLQKRLDEESFQDIVNLSNTTLQEIDDRASAKHPDEKQQSIGKNITSSASIELSQSEETGLDTQSSGIGKTTQKTLVHSSCLSISNMEDNTAFTNKRLCCDEQDSHVKTKEAGPSLDNALGRFCLLVMPNVDEKELIQESRSLHQTQLCQSEGNSLVQSSEPEKSALEPTTCYSPWPLEPNDVETGDITQTASSSSVLGATRKTLNEEKNNSDVRVNSTKKSNRSRKSVQEEKCRKEDQVKITKKLNTLTGKSLKDEKCYPPKNVARTEKLLVNTTGNEESTKRFSRDERN